MRPYKRVAYSIPAVPQWLSMSLDMTANAKGYAIAYRIRPAVFLVYDVVDFQPVKSGRSMAILALVIVALQYRHSHPFPLAARRRPVVLTHINPTYRACFGG